MPEDSFKEQMGFKTSASAALIVRKPGAWGDGCRISSICHQQMQQYVTCERSSVQQQQESQEQQEHQQKQQQQQEHQQQHHQ